MAGNPLICKIHHAAIFDGFEHCDRGLVLISCVISQDYVIISSLVFIGGTTYGKSYPC